MCAEFCRRPVRQKLSSQSIGNHDCVARIVARGDWLNTVYAHRIGHPSVASLLT